MLRRGPRIGSRLRGGPERTGDRGGAPPRLEDRELRRGRGPVREASLPARDAPLEPTREWHNGDLIRQAMDLPKEEWNLVDLARELHLGPFEAKKLEVSLRIFEGGGYKITTKAGPEPRAKKPKAEAHVVPSRKERTEDDEDTGHEEAESRRPTPPKASAKPADSTPAKCETHHAPGAERHACGAWLCKACLEAGGACPSCKAPLVTPADREARRKDREADF